MASRTIALLYTSLYFLQGLQVSQAACGNSSTSPAQLDTMLAEYDREAPPPDAPVLVELTLDVRHATVSEPTSTVRLLADLRMKWQDNRLAWNSSDVGCEWTLVPAERLWLPDVAALNAVEEGSVEGGEWMRSRLASDGGVVSVRRLDLTVPLSLDLLLWPDDQQTAVFKFGSRAHDIDEIDTNISDFKYFTVWESGAWEIVSVWAGTSRAEDVAGAERRVSEWRVSLARRAASTRLAGSVTLLASLLLLLAASLLPPLTRAPLYACIAFISCLWLSSALQRLPGAASTPRVLSVMCALCVCAALATVCAALVSRIARLRSPPPRTIRDIVDYLSRRLKISLNEGSSGAGAASSGTWAACAQLLDYGVLALVALTNLILAAVYFF